MLVVFYLLGLSWTSVALAVPSFLRVSLNDRLLKFVEIFHSCLIFAFAVVFLTYAETFGSSHCCNSTAKAVFFISFSALHVGRKVGWAIVISVAVFYAVHSVREVVVVWSRREEKGGQSDVEGNLKGETDVEESEEEMALSKKKTCCCREKKCLVSETESDSPKDEEEGRMRSIAVRTNCNSSR